jgi:DHA3 family macrolide efflux protein-like MFS transporter
MFVRSVAGGFHWPAMAASTSLMVPDEQLTRVQGLNQMLQGGMSIVSAPAGALLLDVLPVQGILAIDVGTALLAILPLLFIAIPQPERRQASAAAQQTASIWQEFKIGLRYMWSWPALLMILCMATLINFLLTPASSLQPLLVTQHFNGTAIHLAWMETAMGLGIIVGGLLLSAWGGFRRRIMTTLVGLTFLGIGMGAVGLVPAGGFWLAVGLVFVVGAAMPIVNGPVLAIIQASVEPDMQGRVFTLIQSISAGMAPLGLLIAGPMADTFGVRAWYLVGGAVTMLMGLAGFVIPSILNIEEDRARQQHPQSDTASIVIEPGD